MKLHKFAFVFAVLTCSAAACGRANDLPAMRTEADGVVKTYAARFEELNRRGDAIMQRGNAIGVSSPDAQTASRLFSAAKAKLDEMRGLVTSAPADLGKVAKDRFEMRRTTDLLHHKLESSYTEINADFDAVESWISVYENKPKQVARAPEVKVAPPVAAPTEGAPPPPPPAPGGAHDAHDGHAH